MGSMSPASFPPKAPTIRRPLPSTGSLRVGSPASSLLLSAPTPCHPSPQASLPSPSDTASAPASSLPSPEGCFPREGIRKRSPALPLRIPFDGDDRASQVPGGPQCLHALLFDPDGTLALLLIMPGCCLPQEIRRRLPQRIFRGSITRPTDPLCTLRSLGYPRTTQHSVPAASTLCRVELFTYRIPQRSFYFLMEASPPSRLCLAHIPPIKSVQEMKPSHCSAMG